MLHGAAKTVYRNFFPNMHLVFHQHEETGDDVADQIFGPEPDGQSQNASTGEKSRNIDAKFRQDGNQSDEENHIGSDVYQEALDGLNALLGAFVQAFARHGGANDYLLKDGVGDAGQDQDDYRFDD